MSENKRKFLLLAFLGIVITLIGYQTAIDAQDTANTALQPPPVVCNNFTFLQSFGGNNTICNTVPLQGTLSYFFTNQTSVNTLSPSKRMLAAPDSNLTTQIKYVNPADMQIFQNWTTRQGLPEISFIPAGSYRVHVHASINKPNFAMIFAEVWEVNNTGVPLGLIGTTEHENLTDNAETEFDMDFTTNNTWFMNSTQSRLQVQIFAHVLQDSPDITLYFDGVTNARLSLPSQTVDASNFVPYVGATQDINLSAHNITTTGNVIANNVNSSYFREFWQRQGTVVQGTWSWMNDSNQADYASVTGDTAGAWSNLNIQNDEYKWSSIFLTQGTYTVRYSTIKFHNGGIVELLFGSTSLGTFDTYDAGFVYNTVVTTTFSLQSPTTADLRIRSTTKNASSGGYAIRISRIEVAKAG